MPVIDLQRAKPDLRRYSVKEVAEIIGRSPSYVSGVKKAMGVTGWLKLQETVDWIDEHPGFRISHVWPKKASATGLSEARPAGLPAGTADRCDGFPPRHGLQGASLRTSELLRGRAGK